MDLNDIFVQIMSVTVSNAIILIITRWSGVCSNRGLSNGPASSYVYKTIYGHKKVCHKKVCLEQNILLGPLYGIRSFHAPFHHFS